jgi:hypothetical protein
VGRLPPAGRVGWRVLDPCKDRREDHRVFLVQPAQQGCVPRAIEHAADARNEFGPTLLLGLRQHWIQLGTGADVLGGLHDQPDQPGMGEAYLLIPGREWHCAVWVIGMYACTTITQIAGWGEAGIAAWLCVPARARAQ